MTIEYTDLETLVEASDPASWVHEGVGSIEATADGAVRLTCRGSRQGQEGCMAFLRQPLPDQIAVEYTLTVKSRGGLIINYLALRGVNGEDLFDPRLPKRTGIMPNYWATQWGLQSYHVSICRFNDRGQHTGTSNWRRNPGARLVGHGEDPIREIDRAYRVRITKDRGHGQLFVDGVFAHGFVDHATNLGPIPDHGRFGFRLVGQNVVAEFRDLSVRRIEARDLWGAWVYDGTPG